jgi:uncharacterized membrane protein YeaQ/YmgE (transglycosylase-associated protein family)
MFGLLMTIIVGFIVGVIAKLIMPGKENMGFVITTLLGIAGSLVATYAGQAVGGTKLDRERVGSVRLSALLCCSGSIRSFRLAGRRLRYYLPASLQYHWSTENQGGKATACPIAGRYPLSETNDVPVP